MVSKTVLKKRGESEIPFSTFRNLTRLKRDRITAAATEEFSGKGYARASINAIVERLGIAKGSIFQYFGDKKGLFLFVFQTSMDMVKDYLRKVRDRTHDENLPARLEATLKAGMRFSIEHPIIYRMYIRIMFEYDIPFRNEILLSLREYSLKYLRSLLETAKLRGELRDGLDLDTACFILDALMDRFLQARTVPHLDGGLDIFESSEQVSEEWIKQIVQTICSGIGHG
jgi:TetR/AcrR family transcriptional regulator